MPPPLTILVIDDEPAICDLVSACLLETGKYAVKSTTDPAHGLHLAMDSPPDLFILDVKMPGFDGLVLAKLLALNPTLAMRPIVFYSGWTEGAENCREAGGKRPTRFVTKGQPIQTLLDAVEELLAR